MKKRLSFILALAILLTCLPMQAWAEEMGMVTAEVSTGDTTPIVPLIVVMVVSGTALLVILFLSLRKKNRGNRRRK